METTLALVADRGLRAVTMSEIAARAGIGRATLYKYFADVESILVEWHERHLAEHVEHLAGVRTGAGSAMDRLEGVLSGYASVAHEHHGTELAMLLHQRRHAANAQHQLHQFIEGLLTEAAAAGEVRDDVPARELTTYCLHALGASASLPSKAAARRLVKVILAGLAPLDGTREARTT